MTIYYGNILPNNNRRKIQFNDRVHTNISFFMSSWPNNMLFSFSSDKSALVAHSI